MGQTIFCAATPFFASSWRSCCAVLALVLVDVPRAATGINYMMEETKSGCVSAYPLPLSFVNG